MTNYFDILEIPVSLDIDADVLRKNYYRLSRQYHPDLMMTSDEMDRNEMTRHYENINKAYETLSDKWRLIKHVLAIHDMMEDPEHEKLPQAFLMDMMDINEALFDLQMSNDQHKRQGVLDQIAIVGNELDRDYQKNASSFENQEDKKEALKNIKEYYLKSKYILRIQENLSTFAADSRGIED